MNRRKKLGWFVLGAVAVLLIEAAGVGVILSSGDKRPDAPPEQQPVAMPWGALDPSQWQASGSSSSPDDSETTPSQGPLPDLVALIRARLEGHLDTDRERVRLPWPPSLPADADSPPALGFLPSIMQSILDEAPHAFDPDRDGVRTYNLLALSGGGAKGAFGAGLLSGWSASGQRPTFKVVTGVSTGSLQATQAFLGSDYDPMLREIFTAYTSDDIYTRRQAVTGLVSDSLYDSAPLRRLIAKYMTQDELEHVAAEHAKGRRLFIGTMNMDTNQFVIWDMGKIASSGRPDALQRYRDVLLASCSTQVFLPPVYFPVEAGGKTYYEMHGDGATYAQAFFRGFLLDFEDTLKQVGLTKSKAQANLYIIINGEVGRSESRTALEPRTLSIAAATIQHLLRMRVNSSLYRMYVLTHRYGFDFNMAAIPQGYEPAVTILDFDPVKMKQLFDTGYNLAANGYDWMKAPPHLDPDEIFATSTAPEPK
ncbi:hypothetical protein LCGC14_0276360 [marine sediment metagenome]|uniref:PNPLA domain-containing protein n=1 Tax=marine sediment metagenome TaxID=412755 RepID=A0A0F9X2G6_9ZZZZ